MNLSFSLEKASSFSPLPPGPDTLVALEPAAAAAEEAVVGSGAASASLRLSLMAGGRWWGGWGGAAGGGEGVGGVGSGGTQAGETVRHFHLISEGPDSHQRAQTVSFNDLKNLKNVY